MQDSAPSPQADVSPEIDLSKNFVLPAEGEYDERTLDLLLDRAKLFEAEALKDAGTLLSKAAAGLAGLFAISAATATALDTLWWRPFTGNPSAIPLGIVELLLSIASALCFLLAFKRIPLDVSPAIEEVGQWNAIIRNSFVHAKIDLLASIQRDVVKNERAVEARNFWTQLGFFGLAILLVVVAIHAAWSGTIKSETERREAIQAKAQEEERHELRPKPTAVKPSAAPSAKGALRRPTLPADDNSTGSILRHLPKGRQEVATP